jgi:hypothetical protein
MNSTEVGGYAVDMLASANYEPGLLALIGMSGKPVGRPTDAGNAYETRDVWRKI